MKGAISFLPHSFAQAKIEAARGNSTGANQKRIQANVDYMAAIDHYTRIRDLERIPPALNGVLLFDRGYAQAHLAHGNRNAILITGNCDFIIWLILK